MKVAENRIEDDIRSLPAPAETRYRNFDYGVEALLHDLRYAARVLYKKPGFAAIAIVTLALGIGANAAIFSVVNASILTPIPVPEPDRVVMVWSDRVDRSSSNFPASVPDFIDWRSTGIFGKLAAYSTDAYNLLIGTRPERVPGIAATREWFEISQVKPLLGRVFRDEDMQPGHNQVVILTYKLWRSRFNAEPGIIGKTIIVNSSPYLVIGVLPKRLANLSDEELYVPLVFDPGTAANRGMRGMEVVGRLAPGITLQSAQGTMNGISARLRRDYPLEDGDFEARLQPIEAAYVENVQSLLLVLFGAVGFVLLVACANIANLLLVRGTTRRREIAIRTALGAGKSRLITQLLTESILLGVMGGLAGIVPAIAGIRFLTKFQPERLPNTELVTLNPEVLLFTFALAVCTGVLFGIIPALDAWRSSAITPLRERSQSSGGRLRFGNLFVVGEIAVTVVLVAGAILMLRSFIHLRNAYPGYDVHALTMRVSLTGKQYSEPGKQTSFYKELLRRVSALPGVRAAGAIDCLPTCTDTEGGVLHFTDRPEPKQNDALVIISFVTPDYLHAMGIRLVRGRYFSDADGERDPLTVIIDEATARRYWPNRDPIGQSIKLRMSWPLRRIVGIVGNIDRNLAVKMKGGIGQAYVPAAQQPTSDMSLAISSPMSLSSLIPEVRREISALAPDQPVYEVQTMAQARAATQMSSEFGAWLLGFFALLALSLAAIGVYGVISYTVQQRTRDIGVQMALGATPGQLLSSVLSRGLLLVIIGLTAGLIGALALNTTMKDLLTGLSTTDPLSFLGTIVLLAVVGLLATFIPAWRASRIDPMIALRHE